MSCRLLETGAFTPGGREPTPGDGPVLTGGWAVSARFDVGVAEDVADVAEGKEAVVFPGAAAGASGPAPSATGEAVGELSAGC